MKKPRKIGESCRESADCVLFNCVKGICEMPTKSRRKGAKCACDYHCYSGHCSYTPTWWDWLKWTCDDH